MAKPICECCGSYSGTEHREGCPLNKTNLYLVEAKNLIPSRRPIYASKYWKLRRLFVAPVFAVNAVQAAEYAIARMVEAKSMPKNCVGLRIMVCQHVNDGKPGFKVCANSDGDIRYDVRLSRNGTEYFPVYSEKSFAGESCKLCKDNGCEACLGAAWYGQ